MKRRPTKRWWPGYEGEIPVYEYPGWDLPGLMLNAIGAVLMFVVRWIVMSLRALNAKAKS
jgi:hypothetical protein